MIFSNEIFSFFDWKKVTATYFFKDISMNTYPNIVKQKLT